MIMLELGLNSFSTIIAVYIVSIRAYTTSGLLFIFTIGTIYFASHVSEYQLVVDTYKYTQLSWFIAF